MLAREDGFRTHAIQSMTGTSGRQRARAEALESYPFLLPSDGRLWRGLGELIEPLFARIFANAEESRTLAQTRDLLLPKLMSGEIRVREAERAVAEVL
jgi:type I restriction enzyme S subunit